VPNIRYGFPTVFISHGTDDLVAPIDQCSRITVPKLQADGYAVQFVEYPSATEPPGNGHYVTPEVLTQAMTYLSQAVGGGAAMRSARQ
jgi:predicted esterase